MYKVKVPATSANLGSGFDVLGVALNIFNEYTFEVKPSFSLKGFHPKYLEFNKNLVLSSYKKAFEFLGEDPIPVEICEISKQIPRAGGLGSSAACAVSGILGANLVMGGRLTVSEILQIATKIDGHPDNVSACVLGGLTACQKQGEKIFAEKYNVSEDLNFLVCYPDFYVSTEMARSILPKTYERYKVVENLSAIVNLPRAFESGNIELLKRSVKDNIHQPYRIELIEEGKLIFEKANSLGACAVISGSGATILVVSKGSVLSEFEKLETKRKWTFIDAKPYFGE